MSDESNQYCLLEFNFEGKSVERLDKLLVDAIASDPDHSELSRSKIKRLIEAGHVYVDGKGQTKAGQQIKPGSLISCKIAGQVPQELTPWDFGLDIVHEDEHLMVVNKPAGLTVHPGAGNPDKTLANALRYYFEKNKGGSAARAGIVHRLDKDTTGLLLIAKNVMVLSALTQMLSERRIARTYNCLVFVTPRAKRAVQRDSEGVVETLIGRHERKRTCMAVLENSGRRAVTRWKKIQELGYCCELEISLETGRTHQIRVHMDHLKSPVLGDQSYGDFSGLPQVLQLANKKFARQALHACRLEFVHPVTSQNIAVEQNPPIDYLNFRKVFEDYGVGD